MSSATIWLVKYHSFYHHKHSFVLSFPTKLFCFKSSHAAYELTSSCGDAESSLSDRYMTICGMCPMDICSSAVSSPHSRRTSWLTGGEAFILGSDEESVALPLSDDATVSKVSRTWKRRRIQETEEREERWKGALHDEGNYGSESHSVSSLNQPTYKFLQVLFPKVQHVAMAPHNYSRNGILTGLTGLF